MLKNDYVQGYVHLNHESKLIVNRMDRVIKQMEYVVHLAETNTDSSEVLVRLAEVRSSINGLGKTLLQNHIESCMAEEGEEEGAERISEYKYAIDRFFK